MPGAPGHPATIALNFAGDIKTLCPFPDIARYSSRAGHWREFMVLSNGIIADSERNEVRIVRQINRRECSQSFRAMVIDLYGKTTYTSPMSLSRTSRLEARIAPETLTIVKRAAELQGQSVSQFVVAAAREAANRTIEETQIVRLSVSDQRAFAEAVLNPAPPGKALRRAADAYRKHLKANG